MDGTVELHVGTLPQIFPVGTHRIRPVDGAMGARPVPDNAREVVIRRNDTYVGRITELIGTPFVFFPKNTPKGHQTDLREGADCVSTLIYGQRRLGRRIPYVGPAGLDRFTALVPAKRGEQPIRVGDVLHFGAQTAEWFPRTCPRWVSWGPTTASSTRTTGPSRKSLGANCLTPPLLASVAEPVRGTLKIGTAGPKNGLRSWVEYAIRRFCLLCRCPQRPAGDAKTVTLKCSSLFLFIFFAFGVPLTGCDAAPTEQGEPVDVLPFEPAGPDHATAAISPTTKAKANLCRDREHTTS